MFFFGNNCLRYFISLLLIICGIIGKENMINMFYECLSNDFIDKEKILTSNQDKLYINNAESAGRKEEKSEEGKEK